MNMDDEVSLEPSCQARLDENNRNNIKRLDLEEISSKLRDIDLQRNPSSERCIPDKR